MGSTTTTTTTTASTRMPEKNGTCIDDTDMFGQMPEPKCRFLLGEMGFGCDWTLNQINADCPACNYDYTGKDMNMILSSLCCATCSGLEPESTTTTTTTTTTASTRMPEKNGTCIDDTDMFGQMPEP